MIANLNLILNSYITQLNSSKYLAGIMMLLMNLGGRYISAELSEAHEKILNHRIIRRLLVFVLVFYATRDIKVSLILTCVFIILVSDSYFGKQRRRNYGDFVWCIFGVCLVFLSVFWCIFGVFGRILVYFFYVF